MGNFSRHGLPTIRFSPFLPPKMKSPSRLSPRSSLVASSLVLALLSAVQSASAATQDWVGGSANWTSTSTNFPNVALTNTNIARFAGTGGTVGIADSATATNIVTTAGLQIDVDNYVIGNGTANSSILISPQTTDTSGIVVGAGVSGTSINASTIRLTSAGSGTSILLTNTDLVNFNNTTIQLSGTRTTKISNSSPSGTTTFAKLAVTDKLSGGAWPNGTILLNQGNLVINKLYGGSTNNTGAVGAYTNTTVATYQTTFGGTGTGTLTVNGNNTLYTNSNTGSPLIFKFDMASGTLALGNDGALGGSATNKSILAMNGGTVIATATRAIANPVTATGNFAIGGSNDITFSGSYTQSVAAATASRTLTISNTANTTLSGNVFLANEVTAAHTLKIGGTGNLTISGVISNDSTATNAFANSLQMEGTGTLTLSNTNTYTGATNVNSGTLLVNGSTAGASTVAVASGAILGGSGTVGGATTLTSATIGSSGNTLTLGSTLTTTGTSSLAAGSTVNVAGATSVNSGTFTVNGNLGASGTIGGAGTVLVSSTGNITGTATINSPTSVSGGTLGSSGNTLTLGSTLTTTGGTIGTGATVNVGGATTFSSGNFTVDGTLGGAGTKTVSLGATLFGHGTVGGATTINGTLAPGNSPGIMTFTGDLTLAGTTVMEINGTGRGTTYDGVDLTGGVSTTLTYGGTLTMSFNAPITAGVYDLFSLGLPAANQAGDFASVGATGTEVSSFSGLVITPGVGWVASLVDTQGVPNTWTLAFDNLTGDLTVAAIPEPSTYAVLAGFGVLGLAVYRRRRVAKAA
jgi:trimeric autotransporter adhesin